MLKRSDNEWFGLALYSPHIDEHNVTPWVESAIVKTGGLVCGVQLVELTVTSTKTGQSGVPRRVDEKCLKDILKRTTEGKINRLYGYDEAIDPNASLRGRRMLFFKMTATRIYSSEPRDLIIFGPRELYDACSTLSYIRRIVGEFPIDYGFVTAGLTRFHIDASLSFTHSVHVEDDNRLRRYGTDHPRRLFGREISYYQSKTRQFAQYIPRASWANILSPTHVEALGGEDRIRKECGAYLVERWGNNLYVQITESLWDCSNEDLTRLNRFFAPARFPDAPEAVYLDASSDAYTIY